MTEDFSFYIIRADRHPCRMGVPVEIESDAEFVIYSESEGVISEHNSEADALKAFTEHLKKHKEPIGVEPVIYRRGPTGWDLFN